MNKINSVLKEVLENIKPTEELKEIRGLLDGFLEKVERELGKRKINAEIFVGGSFAKNTIIRKDYYDIDVFLRFDKRYEEDEISNLAEKVLGFAKPMKIHGSRDYFRVKVGKDCFIEIIPVVKIKKPEDSNNVTDLSYSHVKYVRKKLKGKIVDDVLLAKAFCYAHNCYGAESYINGFSGYALELLVYHYKGFLKFIGAMNKIKEKEVIDIEKKYKNKQEVLMNVNSSKLESPIVLIDPTFKRRNALAALSNETLGKFQKACMDFLKNPSLKSFEVQKTDLGKIKKEAERKKLEFILLEAKTSKQEGDIAGSKLLKFYNHLTGEISRFFDVKKKGFNYNGKKSARYFFVMKKKKELLIEGPSVKDEKNVKRFKKVHKNCFVKGGKVLVRESIDFGIKEFIKKWVKKNKGKMKGMGIVGLI